jgi:hypothetical protein
VYVSLRPSGSAAFTEAVNGLPASNSVPPSTTIGSIVGHRSAGGVRASIYNWVSLADVDALVELITEFGR